MQRPGYVICYKAGGVLRQHDIAHRISVKHSVQDYRRAYNVFIRYIQLEAVTSSNDFVKISLIFSVISILVLGS